MHAYPLAKRPTRAGFTLIEMIGVMVVISILFAAAVPSVVNLIRTQRSGNERAALPGIATALKLAILREQRFPVLENASTVATNTQPDQGYWWNLAARHGGGSALDARYPLGIRSGGANTRKLYFAKASWGGQTFFQVTGNGTTWLNDPLDPQELRLLLVSTANPDLPLPNALTDRDQLEDNQFDALWNDWAVGEDGNPARNWTNYGLSATEWEGRAPELNVERIDLRDWLCTVVIENRRFVSALNPSPEDPPSPDPPVATIDVTPLLTFLADPLPVLGTYNLQDTRLQLDFEAVPPPPPEDPPSGDPPSEDQVLVKKLFIIQAGRLIDENMPAGYIIGGQKPDGTTTSERTRLYDRTDTESTRAPIALLFPPESPLTLSDWDHDDEPIQNRYFLKTQELLLGEPWEDTEVGIFTITDNFSTLRFDGLQWHY